MALYLVELRMDELFSSSFGEKGSEKYCSAQYDICSNFSEREYVAGFPANPRAIRTAKKTSSQAPCFSEWGLIRPYLSFGLDKLNWSFD
jgi:hypothetical protein